MTTGSVNFNQYTGNGLLDTYEYGFRIYEDDQLLVTTTVPGESTVTLTLGADYTVSGAGASAGGTITLTAGVLADDIIIRIERNVTIEQATDLRNNSNPRMETIEKAFDYGIWCVQQVDSKASRAIRQPAIDTDPIDELPAAAQRANLYLSFDAAGNVQASGGPVTTTVPISGIVQVIDTISGLKAVTSPTSGVVYQTRGYYAAGDGGSGIYRWNAADTTTDNGGSVIQLNAGGTGRWNLIIGPAPLNVRQFGAKGDNSTDDTTAFNNALAVGVPVFVPPATAYIVSNITVPQGSQLFGATVRGYGSFYAGTSVLRRKSGATRIVNSVGKSTYRDLTFDGVDQISAVGIGGTSCGTVLNCTFVNCVSGIGDGGAAYPSTMADQCEFYGNTYGLRNVRDSRIVNCTIAANLSNGIDLQTGANDNIIANNKIEWNQGNGITCNASVHNVFTGNLFDRNYVNGLVLSSASDSNVITGNYFRRNGRNNSGTLGNDSHISVNASNYLTIVGNTTLTGQDDGGTGTFTPKYCATFVNACSNITMEGNDLTGFMTSCFNYSTKPTLLIQRSNQGVTAEEIGSYYQASAGRQYLALFSAVSIAASGAGVTIGTVTAPAVNTYSRQARRLLVLVRDSTAGTTFSAEFNLVVVREGGAASISTGTVYGEVGTAGSITIGGAGTKLRLNFTSIATDGTTYTITGDNPSVTNSLQVTVEVD